MDSWYDVVFLSRLQFAITIMFHYIYPPLTIGLGVLLVAFEALWLKTKNPMYHAMTKFWVSIFALNFAIGVATGIVMEFEFGTNWATYSRFVGDVFGSALAAEGIFAFFLESGFLAVLVFGWDKVGPKMHFFSTLMVALGSMFSAVWIVVANSWQQTPAGYHLVGYDAAGNQVSVPQDMAWDPTATDVFVRAEITDFWGLVFNPSSVIRLTHVLIGSFILGGFFVMSVCGYYIVKDRHVEMAKKGFAIALVFASISSIAQLVAGHFSAVVVAKHQPEKLAAMEAIYHTTDNAGLSIIGMPNDAEGRLDYAIEMPGMLSMMLKMEGIDEVRGLTSWPREDLPPVGITFQTYHIMVACGMYFIGITTLGLFLLWRGKLFNQRWLMWLFVFSVILPYIANQAGWVAAEVGRQPWIVYGLLRTSHSVSKAISADNVMASLILFTLIYLVLFVLFIYLLDRKIRKGPEEPHPVDVPDHTEKQGLREAVTRRGPGQEQMADVEPA